MYVFLHLRIRAGTQTPADTLQILYISLYRIRKFLTKYFFTFHDLGIERVLFLTGFATKRIERTTASAVNYNFRIDLQRMRNQLPTPRTKSAKADCRYIKWMYAFVCVGVVCVSYR